MPDSKDIMGFDEYLYIVTAYDEDGTESEYEFGNLKHAQAAFNAEKNAKLQRYKGGEYELLEQKSEDDVPPLKKARRKYEQVHKDERKESTGQFNTRLPREDFEEINEFLKVNGIPKIALIYAGYEALRQEVERKAKEADDGV